MEAGRDPADILTNKLQTVAHPAKDFISYCNVLRTYFQDLCNTSTQVNRNKQLSKKHAELSKHHHIKNNII